MAISKSIELDKVEQLYSLLTALQGKVAQQETELSTPQKELAKIKNREQCLEL